jgi:hypothetical protein
MTVSFWNILARTSTHDWNPRKREISAYWPPYGATKPLVTRQGRSIWRLEAKECVPGFQMVIPFAVDRNPLCRRSTCLSFAMNMPYRSHRISFQNGPESKVREGERLLPHLGIGPFRPMWSLRCCAGGLFLHWIRRRTIAAREISSRFADAERGRLRALDQSSYDEKFHGGLRLAIGARGARRVNPLVLMNPDRSWSLKRANAGDSFQVAIKTC